MPQTNQDTLDYDEIFEGQVVGGGTRSDVPNSVLQSLGLPAMGGCTFDRNDVPRVVIGVGDGRRKERFRFDDQCRVIVDSKSETRLALVAEPGPVQIASLSPSPSFFTTSSPTRQPGRGSVSGHTQTWGLALGLDVLTEVDGSASYSFSSEGVILTGFTGACDVSHINPLWQILSCDVPQYLELGPGEYVGAGHEGEFEMAATFSMD